MPKKLSLFISLLLAVLYLVPISCSSLSNAIQGISGSPAILGSQGISVSIPPMFSNNWAAAIYVSLKPTSHAVAGQTYTVDLYEKGELRSTSTVSFTQPDINIQNEKMITFPATYDEYNAYFMKDVSNIFSVKIHAPIISTTSYTTESVLINPNKQASLTLTYPKGGEIWHVGETVNITWASTNLTKDAPISIEISNDSGHTLLPLSGGIMPNTGSYRWVVLSSYQKMPGYGNPAPNINTSFIGNRIRIQVECSNIVAPSISVPDLTISVN